MLLAAADMEGKLVYLAALSAPTGDGKLTKHLLSLESTHNMPGGLKEILKSKESILVYIEQNDK